MVALYEDGAFRVPLMSILMLLLLHGPSKRAVLTKNVPAGMYMLAGLWEEQVVAHALNNGFAASVTPSGFAP